MAQDQRTAREYKEFSDLLRGNIRKTDTGEAVNEKTLRDEVEVLKARLNRVEEVLRSMLAVEQLSQAGQEQAQWGRRGEPDVITQQR
jgi:hypothetical protein